MGWSCSAKAGRVLEAWQNACAASTGGSNTWNELARSRSNPIGRKRYFFQISTREHDDGAITGEIFRELRTAMPACRKVGSFRIEADGTVTRAPKFLKRAALAAQPPREPLITFEVKP